MELVPVAVGSPLEAAPLPLLLLLLNVAARECMMPCGACTLSPSWSSLSAPCSSAPCCCCRSWREPELRVLPLATPTVWPPLGSCCSRTLLLLEGDPPVLLLLLLLPCRGGNCSRWWCGLPPLLLLLPSGAAVAPADM